MMALTRQDRRPTRFQTALGMLLLLLAQTASASELRLAGSLEHAWVLTRLNTTEPWKVYHLPATESMSELHRAGRLDAGVGIDGLTAHDQTLWIFNGKVVRQRHATWSELAGRWGYDETVGAPLPGHALSAVSAETGPIVLIRQQPADQIVTQARRRSSNLEALSLILGIPAEELAKSQPDEEPQPSQEEPQPPETEADEPINPPLPTIALAIWTGSTWETFPIEGLDGDRPTLLGVTPAGVPIVSLRPDLGEVDGMEIGGFIAQAPMGVAPLERIEDRFRLGTVTDAQGLVTIAGDLLMDHGQLTRITADGRGAVEVAAERRPPRTVVLGEDQSAGPLAIAATTFDGGLLLAGVTRWDEGIPTLAWAWSDPDGNNDKAGSLTVQPIAPPWSRPDYAIPVFIWITSFLLLLMTLENRRMPVKLKVKQVVLAPFGTRATAGMIDLMPCLLLVMWLFQLESAQLAASWPGQVLANTWTRVMPGLVVIALFILSTGIAEAITGRTAGKALMGIEVRSIDGSKPTILQIIARNLLKSFDLVAVLLLILTLFGPRQRLGDMVAKTLVVVSKTKPKSPNDQSKGSNLDEQG
ncbi:MAG: RDD family protein [Phycisphaeraceae bacterium]